jgi:hypothetical protein
MKRLKIVKLNLQKYVYFINTYHMYYIININDDDYYNF